MGGVHVLDMVDPLFDLLPYRAFQGMVLQLVVQGEALVAYVRIGAEHRTALLDPAPDGVFDVGLAYPPHGGHGHVQGGIPVPGHYYRHMFVVDAPLRGGASPFSRFPRYVPAPLFGVKEKGLVALGDPREIVPVRIRQGGQYLVPPIEGGLLVDPQGPLDLVKALFLHHQGQVGIHLPLFVQPGHPRARVFGKAAGAPLALVPLRPFVLAETNVLPVPAMRAFAHPVVQKVATGGLCPRHALQGQRYFLDQKLSLLQRQRHNLLLKS